MTWKTVTVSTTQGGAVLTKSIKYKSNGGLKEQLIESFGIINGVFELVDVSGSIVALADLDDKGTYYIPSYAGISPDVLTGWAANKLWQTKDTIHDMIKLPDFCRKIIDTPEFQRLRDVKQLGACSLVYIGANNTRFEHCIGTAHLAFKMASALKVKHPELLITYIDVLCVAIAGLCHDLGHGPFSHVWDDLIFPLVGVPKHHKHEDNSLALFRSAIERVRKTDPLLSGLTDVDLVFIQAMIHEEKGASKPWDAAKMGRESAKRFLFEIVSNKRNGLDVDKFDYIQRDCHNTGVKGVFEIDRVIMNAYVGKSEGEAQIVWPEKELENLMAVLQTRESLHRRVYQHRVTKVAEGLYRDIFVSAAPHMQIQADSGEWLSFQDAQLEPSAYLHLSDWLVQYLLHGPHVRIDFDHPDVKKAKELIEQMRARDLWKFVGQTAIKVDDLSAVAAELEEASDGILPARLWEIRESVISWGMGDINPISNVRFINKMQPDEPMRISTDAASKMLPSNFREQSTVIFIKLGDKESRQEATKAFKRWCKKRGVQAITHDESGASLTRVRRRAASDGGDSEEPTPQKNRNQRF